MSSAGKFGKQLKNEEFCLDPDITFFNHGSYGAVPKRVLKKQFSLREETEENPDKFYRQTNPRGYLENLRVLGEHIGARVENTVFVENQTTGFNTIFRSLKFKKGDKILLTNLTYHAVRVLAREFELTPVYVNLEFPLSTEKILKSYEECLKSNDDIKIAAVDHITSPSSVVMPVRDIAAMLRQRGVLVAVDGAHACGQLPLDIESLDVDFYTGNLHKWLWTPRGCAFLWTAPRHRDVIRPCVVSHFHGVGYHVDHCVRGTRDDSPYHCVAEAVKFENEILGGYEAKRRYVSDVTAEGVAVLCRGWGTSCLAVDDDARTPFMTLVQVPAALKYPATAHGAADLETELYEAHRVRVLVMLVEGRLYVRVSVNVYNDVADFERLRDALLEIMARTETPSRDFGYQLPIMHWQLTPLMLDYDK